MNIAELKLNRNLEYHDLIMFMENMELNKDNFRQIPFNKIMGESSYE